MIKLTVFSLLFIIILAMLAGILMVSVFAAYVIRR
jgi:hypothetical protein